MIPAPGLSVVTQSTLNMKLAVIWFVCLVTNSTPNNKVEV